MIALHRRANKIGSGLDPCVTMYFPVNAQLGCSSSASAGSYVHFVRNRALRMPAIRFAGLPVHVHLAHNLQYHAAIGGLGPAVGLGVRARRRGVGPGPACLAVFGIAPFAKPCECWAGCMTRELALSACASMYEQHAHIFRPKTTLVNHDW